MILITSAAYVNPGLASEFGKLPPCMLPVQNRRLYEHQVALFPDERIKILSLPESYTLSAYDNKRLSELEVKVVFVPVGLSLGESIVYVLNVTSRYNEPIRILHGDTLFSQVGNELDTCVVAKAEDNYDWASANHLDKKVYAGYFSFSNQSLLIQKITESSYHFIKGVEEYGRTIPLTFVESDDWLDFGLSNSYYRSIAKMTTQRVFNSMRVTRYSIEKSSKDKLKMFAESNWIDSLPNSMKHYVPSLWNKGEKGDVAYYEIEYYYLSSLASIYTFGENSTYIWEEIINSCVEYLNEEMKFKPDDKEKIARQNDLLYCTKTRKRLQEYAHQTDISLDVPWKINGVATPSLNEIIDETDACIPKQDSRFATLMHGDPCFSNILYDFKSKSIKVIDPRGVDVKGNVCIYGDFRYDVGKLAHSVLGMYDFIIGGMFSYKEHGKYDVCLSFEANERIMKTQEYFKRQRFGGYSLSELSTYPVMIHLFLSMLPLHHDNPLRQKAMLANALKLYVELKNNKTI